MTFEDDPLAELLKLKQQPAHEENDPLAELMATKQPVEKPVAPVEEDKPGVTAKILGTIASTGRDIPGAEAAQAGLSSAFWTGASKLFNRPDMALSYRDARKDIRTAEDAAPAWARIPARVAGGTLAALATPGSAALSGARYGVLSALGSSNPDANVKDRIDNAAIEGVVGAGAGKLSEAVSPLIRSRFPLMLGGPRTPGAVALEQKAERTAIDRLTYDKAAREGAGLAAPPSVVAAMGKPDIAPFVKEIRNSRTYANADDATVLREAYKLMSERQMLLAGKLSGKDFKAGTSLEQSDMNLAKQELLGAGSQMMPTLPKAVGKHAEMMAERDAHRQAVDATRRIGRGQLPAGKNLEANSEEGFEELINAMNPSKAFHASEGVLGTLKAQTGFRANPLKAFGLGPAIQKSARVAPYMRALDAKTGDRTADILRSLGITAITPTGR